VSTIFHKLAFSGLFREIKEGVQCGDASVIVASVQVDACIGQSELIRVCFHWIVLGVRDCCCDHLRRGDVVSEG
jgi:hypothetical protein